jgi:hypothetical protein
VRCFPSSPASDFHRLAERTVDDDTNTTTHKHEEGAGGGLFGGVEGTRAAGGAGGAGGGVGGAGRDAASGRELAISVGGEERGGGMGGEARGGGGSRRRDRTMSEAVILNPRGGIICSEYGGNGDMLFVSTQRDPLLGGKLT